jgi:hypothetical protein
MIELSTLQAIREVVTIIGVIAGLSYYITNIRELRRDRRITLTTTLLEPFMTVEGNNLTMDLLNMEWSDLDDYKRKYDHRVNPENFSKRFTLWRRCDSLGLLYRKGFLDLETIFSGSGNMIENLWRKFRSVIEMYRETDMPKSIYENWEYLAEVLWKEFPEPIAYDFLDPYPE